MKNVTLAIDEETLDAGREYARIHHTSLNRMIRDLLRRAVIREPAMSWGSEFLDAVDRAAGDSGGRPWKRGDLHRE